MVEWRLWETASPAERATALQRQSVVRALLAQRPIVESALKAAIARLGVSRTVLYRLLQRYRLRPKASSLLPFTRGRDRAGHFLDRDRESLLVKTIREFYLTPERPSMAALSREIRRRFALEKMAAPHYRTVERRVRELPLEMVLRKREGAKAARDRLGPVLVSSLRADFPMDLLQIDHTPVDVQIVDQEQRLPIGRPWLSLAIDVATRDVAGFFVSLEAPSALSVCMVLTHAVLPKEQWLSDRDLHTLEWPTCGLPERIHVDNGKEFHSEALERGCEEHGITLEYRPKAQPRFGGHIERLIGTVMGAVHLLPGTTFSNVAQRGSYDSEARAVLTLAELERWLALQIAGVYHLTTHSGLGRSPLEAWKSRAAERKRMLPSDPDDFFLDFLPAVPRLIQRDGIHFHKVRYWANVLSPWAGRRKDPMLVKYDPRNIARVYLRDDDGHHWAIPYANLGQPPIALWELTEARKRLRLAGDHDQREASIFASIQEQRRILKNASSLKSRDRRRKERIPVAPPVTPPAERPAVPTAELKPFPVEFWGRKP